MDLIRTFVAPRLLHGLEATVINKTQTGDLEQFYRGLLRRVQGLSESTAKVAIYLLMGTIPLEAILHQRVLSLFGAISRLDRSNPLYQVAFRQMSVAENKQSWFVYAQHVAAIYNIDIHRALRNPWPKQLWKQTTKRIIKEHWLRWLTQKAGEKSSLSWLILDTETPWRTHTKPHPLWSACSGKQHQVTAATTRARLLVGRHNLQAATWRREQGEDPTCPLCHLEDETLLHLMTRCPKLDHVRAKKIPVMQGLYTAENLDPPQTQNEICSAMLNGGAYQVDRNSPIHTQQAHTKTQTVAQTPVIALSSKRIIPAHQLASSYCHQLVVQRDILINNNIMNTSSGRLA